MVYWTPLVSCTHFRGTVQLLVYTLLYTFCRTLHASCELLLFVMDQTHEGREGLRRVQLIIIKMRSYVGCNTHKTYTIKTSRSCTTQNIVPLLSFACMTVPWAWVMTLRLLLVVMLVSCLTPCLTLALVVSNASPRLLVLRYISTSSSAWQRHDRALYFFLFVCLGCMSSHEMTLKR